MFQPFGHDHKKQYWNYVEFRKCLATNLENIDGHGEYKYSKKEVLILQKVSDGSPFTCIASWGVRSGINVLVCCGMFWDSTICYSYILNGGFSELSKPVVTKCFDEVWWSKGSYKQRKI